MKPISKNFSGTLFGMLGLAVLLLMAPQSCQAEEAKAPESKPAPAAAPAAQEKAAAPAAKAEAAPAAAPAGGKGSIKGKVKLTGTAPQMKPLRMNADPVCAGAHKSPVVSEEVVVGADGGLQWVIVNITEGVTEKAPTPTTPVVLDQKGCQYQPHVFTLYDGQKLEIRNSDETLHNVHCYIMKDRSTCFNRAMFRKIKPIIHEFKERDLVQFKCDVHPWMTAYALIAENPYNTVSGADGSFEIKDVPPGTYKVRAWHEKYGEQVKDVTVKAGEPLTLEFTFQAGA